MDILAKLKKPARLTAGRIALLAVLSLLFIFLLTVYLFLTIYTPPIGESPGLPGFGNGSWGFDMRLVEEGMEAGEYSGGQIFEEMVRVDRIQGDSYTFLVIGRTNDLRTNTIMFWHFDVKNSRISLLSIPRDSWINNSLFRGRINAAFPSRYNQARRQGKSSAEATAEGINFLRQVIHFTFGLPVDRYIFVDLAGFRALVDAVGGVEIYVPMDMWYVDTCQNPPLHINLRRGLQVLDGDKAEQFVRFRSGYADQDIGRIRAQQTFMAALIKKMLVFDMAQIGRILDIAATYTTTNLSASDMTWFALRALGVRLEDIITHTLAGESARAGNASVWSLYEAEAIALINAYYNPFVEDIPAGNFNVFELSRNHAHNANTGGVTMAELVGN